MGEHKKRESTDNNGAAKQGQTADEEGKEKGVISWPRQASYLSRWYEKIPPCLSRPSRRVLLDCEAFSRLILDVKRL